LANTLDSIAGQRLIDGDEAIVVGDTHDGRLAATEALVSQYPFARYLAHDAGRHAWGNPQRNAALQQCRAAYVGFNDDDDIFVPGAFDHIRAAIDGVDFPSFFRFQSYYGPIFWQTPHVLQAGAIGGHCIVTPNDPARLGRWTERYAADFDFIVDTFHKHGAHAQWVDRIITVTRPPIAWRAVTTPADVEALRMLRNMHRQWMTRNRDEITLEQQAAWWKTRDPSRLYAYLFRNPVGATVGAGMLSKRQDNRWWITVLVHPAHFNQGVGTAIYRYLSYAPPGDVWAEILADNAASIRAATKAGYQFDFATDTCVVMVARTGGSLNDA
jgi:RimJ/RimL family protein N-acetyltransferase